MTFDLFLDTLTTIGACLIAFLTLWVVIIAPFTERKSTIARLNLKNTQQKEEIERLRRSLAEQQTTEVTPAEDDADDWNDSDETDGDADDWDDSDETENEADNWIDWDDWDERFDRACHAMKTLQPPLSESCDRKALEEGLADGKLESAFDSDLTMTQVELSATIRSRHTDEQFYNYRVTLNDCTCPDFRFRRKPCKHMVYLAYCAGVISYKQPESQVSAAQIGSLSTLSDALQNEIQNSQAFPKNEKNS